MNTRTMGTFSVDAAGTAVGTAASRPITGWQSSETEMPAPSQETEGLSLRTDHADCPKAVSICDTQPVTAEGVRTLLQDNAELQFLDTMDSLKQALDHVRKDGPDVLLLDKAFGIQAILDWLGDLRA